MKPSTTLQILGLSLFLPLLMGTNDCTFDVGNQVSMSEPDSRHKYCEEPVPVRVQIVSDGGELRTMAMLSLYHQGSFLILDRFDLPNGSTVDYSREFPWSSMAGGGNLVIDVGVFPGFSPGSRVEEEFYKAMVDATNMTARATRYIDVCSQSE